MKPTTSFYFAMVFMVAITASKVFADSMPLSRSVSITDMSVQQIGGDSISLKVKYTPHLTDSGYFKLNFPKYIVPYNAAIGQTSLTISRAFTTNQSDSIVLLMKETQLGSSMLEAAFVMPNAPSGYNNSETKFIDIEHQGSLFRVIDNNTLQLADTAFYILENQSQGSSTLHISGNVRYEDLKQRDWKGVYKVQVKLYFLKEGVTGQVLKASQLYHPFTGNDRHIHYDICDINGAFSFNFTGPDSWSQYSKVVLVVSKYNESARMYSGGSAYILAQGTIGSPVSIIDLFSFGLSQGAELGISNSQNISHNNVTITVNRQDGGMLRNMQLSRDFTYDRYSGNPTYSLPQIGVDRKDNLQNNNVNVAGLFICNGFTSPFNTATRHIELDNQYYDLSTVSHEYGHYVNYRIWTQSCNVMGQASSQIKEGWAIFYSFAVRSYAQHMYDEYIIAGSNKGYYRITDDNTEESPFATLRFDGIRYAHPPTGYTPRPEYAAFGCYLWNLYDSPLDGVFMSPRYSGANNDDISEPLRVFEIFRTNPGDHSPSYFNDKFKDGQQNDFKNSTDNIYDFLLGSGNDPMSSSQIINVSAVPDFQNNEITFTYTSSSYSENSSIQPQAFNVSYSNPEFGMKLYKKEGSSWETKAATDLLEFVWSPVQDIRGEYLITATNYPGLQIASDNDSWNAKYFDFRLPNVVIRDEDGFFTYCPWETVTMSPTSIEGQSPYSYTWYLSSDNINWTQVSTSTNYDLDCNNLSPSQTHYIKLVMVDDKNETAQDIKSFFVMGSCSDKRSPDNPVIRTGTEFSLNLSVAVPNPTSTNSKIEYTLSEPAFVDISIRNVTCQEVLRLVGIEQTAGEHSIVIDASKLTSGKYEAIFIATASDNTKIQKSTSISIIK